MQAATRDHTRSSPTRALKRARSTRRRAAACVLAIASLALAPAIASSARASRAAAPELDSATLEQCVTSVAQSERSATFSGEMTAVPGTLRMAMRIELQEEPDNGETGFRTVTAPGLGGWRASDPKIKIYKYVKQVTNLSSPEQYRALVRFRWLGAKGRVIKHAWLLTSRCVQPAAPAPPPAPAPA
jgi:hypothetical protein